MLDASRSVPVVAALLDDSLRDEFVQEVNEEYQVRVCVCVCVYVLHVALIYLYGFYCVVVLVCCCVCVVAGIAR